MHILVDIRHLTGHAEGGVNEYTRQLLTHLFLLDNAHSYTLLSAGRRRPNKTLLDPWLSHTHVHHVHISTPNKILSLRARFLQSPTINWYIPQPVDLIFLPNLNITTLPTDIPTVLTAHDLSWNLLPELFSARMRLWHRMARPKHMMRACHSILTPSEHTKRDVIAHTSIPKERVHVIPHGIPEQCAPRMKAQDHGTRSRLRLPKRFALFLGTIEPRKNLHMILDGMEAYRERTRDDLHLVIAGRWGWKSHNLRRRLWQKQYQSWVHQIGPVAQEERAALYRSADVLVWPSLYEGFGMPVLEAMACGTPVITSDNTSLPEVTGGAAVMIDPYNANDLSDALEGLLGSDRLQQTLSEQGIRQAGRFSWKQSAEETVKVFEQAEKD